MSREILSCVIFLPWHYKFTTTHYIFVLYYLYQQKNIEGLRLRSGTTSTKKIYCRESNLLFHGLKNYKFYDLSRPFVILIHHFFILSHDLCHCYPDSPSYCFIIFIHHHMEITIFYETKQKIDFFPYPSKRYAESCNL
jgi:hypothetical protein